jgi:hypothetical protein
MEGTAVKNGTKEKNTAAEGYEETFLLPPKFLVVAAVNMKSHI